MRDIAILLALIAVIPAILRRPWIGPIAWVVVSVMNPHRMAYGFSYSLPVALLIVIATLLGLLFSKGEKHLPVTSVTTTLAVFVGWMCLTTYFAMYPDLAYVQWVKVMKIMFMIFIGLTLLHSKQHINVLVWAIVISLGFYGTKGGIFALMTGGAFKVYGPPESEVADNNAISFALVMVLPLMMYLASTVENRWAKWVKRGIYAMIGFSTVAILASHSRGAFLALAAMTAFLWLKSEKRLKLGLIIAIAIPLLIGFMPSEWMERMNTIKTYDQDASSMGRINTWWMTFNLAKDNPILGGGFQIYEIPSFAKWAPDPNDIHAAHSIYFAAMGEHGFVGLAIFLTLCLLAWRACSSVVRLTKGRKELAWANQLGRMLQVSLIGYWVGGAFLSVLYFDVFYYLIMCIVLLKVLIENELKASSTSPQRSTGFPPVTAALRRTIGNAGLSTASQRSHFVGNRKT